MKPPEVYELYRICGKIQTFTNYKTKCIKKKKNHEDGKN